MSEEKALGTIITFVLVFVGIVLIVTIFYTGSFGDVKKSVSNIFNESESVYEEVFNDTGKEEYNLDKANAKKVGDYIVSVFSNIAKEDYDCIFILDLGSLGLGSNIEEFAVKEHYSSIDKNNFIIIYKGDYKEEEREVLFSSSLEYKPCVDNNNFVDKSINFKGDFSKVRINGKDYDLVSKEVKRQVLYKPDKNNVCFVTSDIANSYLDYRTVNKKRICNDNIRKKIEENLKIAIENKGKEAAIARLELMNIYLKEEMYNQVLYQYDIMKRDNLLVFFSEEGYKDLGHPDTIAEITRESLYR